jgi:hypothetical protein
MMECAEEIAGEPCRKEEKGEKESSVWRTGRKKGQICRPNDSRKIQPDPIHPFWF